MKTEITKQAFSLALQKCGIKQGDVLLIHSDLRPFGLPKDCNSREEILKFYLDGFLEAIGTEGTLIVPAYFYEYARFGVPFDVTSSSVSQPLGAFSDYVCRQPGRVRSCSPLQSLAAIGKRAEEICGGDSLSGYGINSPWHRFRLAKGKVIFVGTDLQSMTYIHYIEQQYGVPHLYIKLYTTPVLRSGMRIPGLVTSAVRYLEYDVHYSLKSFQDVLQNKHILRQANAGEGIMFAADGQAVYDEAIQLLSANLYAFLKRPPTFVPGKIPFDGATGAKT